MVAKTHTNTPIHTHVHIHINKYKRTDIDIYKYRPMAPTNTQMKASELCNIAGTLTH